MEKISRDEIAQRLWRLNYDQLSEFGKRKVDLVAGRLNPRDEEVEDDRVALLEQQNLRLTAQLKEARLENLELWQELEEARTQLAELGNPLDD